MHTPRFIGTAVGTGAILNISLGFVPTWARITNISSSAAERIYWNVRMAGAGTVMAEGEKFTYGASSIAWAKLTKGLGISPFNGTSIASGSSAYVAPKKSNSTYSGNMQGNAKKWVLDTSANATGHFDAAIDTTYVKVGSLIEIRQQNGFVNPILATITALTSTGAAADQVTLDRSIASGEIVSIRYPYDLVQALPGQIGPGITLAADTDVNVASEIILVEAGVDDLYD